MKEIFIIILLFVCSCSQLEHATKDYERHGFKAEEEVLVNGKYKGFVKPIPSGINENMIYVQWIDYLGTYHDEYIDYRFISHK